MKYKASACLKYSLMMSLLFGSIAYSQPVNKEIQIDILTTKITNLLQAKREAEAIEYFKQLEVLQPDLPEVFYFYYIDVLDKSGNNTDALKKSESYLNLFGKKGKYYNQVIEINARLSTENDKVKAIEAGFVVIPAGSFQMGSNDDSWEKPVHSVSVNSFAIGKYEVTRGQFSAFVNDSNYDAGNSCYGYENGSWNNKTGSNWKNPGYSQTDQDPVACVNWSDAQAYIQWLNKKLGQSYRLPTEAEWEYACRGGSQQTYCGSDDINAVAWYTQNSAKKTQAVGQKAANGFGLYDMSGNVWEWVQDGWHNNYQGAPTDGREWTEGVNTAKHVVRGGSWDNSATDARAASRGNGSPGNRSSAFGFRLARTVP